MVHETDLRQGASLHRFDRMVRLSVGLEVWEVWEVWARYRTVQRDDGEAARFDGEAPAHLEHVVKHMTRRNEIADVPRRRHGGDVRQEDVALRCGKAAGGRRLLCNSDLGVRSRIM